MMISNLYFYKKIGLTLQFLQSVLLPRELLAELKKETMRKHCYHYTKNKVFLEGFVQ